MEVIRDLKIWQEVRRKLEKSPKPDVAWLKSEAALPADSASTMKIGFVPTMGALHLGHNSLINKSVLENDLTVLSIFVNPTQFNNSQDFQTYPQTLQNDLDMATKAGVDFVLVPEAQQMYPDNYNFKMTETHDSQILEGVFRPGHFDGMLTVVLKLLNLVRPTNAYFGEKDFQQFQLVRGMCEALFLDCKIIPCPTLREESGLAMSSRNARLSPSAREKSKLIAQALRSSSSPAQVKASLEANGFTVEYVSDWKSRRLVAVQIDGVRLIDNVPLT